MRIIFIFLFLSIQALANAQSDEIIRLVFSDSTNFKVTTSLGHSRPAKYYVLGQTNTWNTFRFYIKENIESEEVRKQLINDEHHPYVHTYIFRNNDMNKLFPESEKKYLLNEAKQKQPKAITIDPRVAFVIPSFETAQAGFFFSITEPIYSQDKQFAFVDMYTFYKDSLIPTLNDAYFATTILVFKKTEDSWVRIYKADHLIL